VNAIIGVATDTLSTLVRHSQDEFCYFYFINTAKWFRRSHKSRIFNSFAITYLWAMC